MARSNKTAYLRRSQIVGIIEAQPDINKSQVKKRMKEQFGVSVSAEMIREVWNGWHETYNPFTGSKNATPIADSVTTKIGFYAKTLFAAHEIAMSLGGYRQALAIIAKIREMDGLDDFEKFVGFLLELEPSEPPTSEVIEPKVAARRGRPRKKAQKRRIPIPVVSNDQAADDDLKRKPKKTS